MFVTSTQKHTMSGQQQNAESERQHLLDRLLDAVKQCQVRFGGKSELATDGDSRVVCLLTQFEAIFQHGFKKTRVSAFRQVGQVAGIVKLDSEAVFWSFVKAHLGKLDEERFLSLQKATTDAGRGRAWLRCALNEHSLERYFHNMLGNKSLLSQFYDKEAFLMDEERASMLPMTAAGLSPILFALSVDNEELNIVRQQAPTLPINKEVLSSILPSFPHKPDKPVVEPAPVVSAVLTDDSKKEKKKKKKKKKRNAAIVSIEEGDSQQDITSDVKDFPINDTSSKEIVNSNSEGKSSSLGHTRSSSYPGNITVVSEGSAVKTSRVNGQDIVFTEITKSISLPDNSVPVEHTALISSSTKSKSSSFNLEEFLEHVTTEPRYDTVGEGVEEAPSGEDTGNFVFGAADLFLKQPKVDQEEINPSEFQNDRKSSSLISAGSEITSDAVHPIQENSAKVKKNYLFQRQDDSGSEDFETRFSSTITSQYAKDGKDDLSQRKRNFDSFNVYSLTKNESEESNFSIAQVEIAGVMEKTVTYLDAEATNGSQETTTLISHLDAQEHQDFKDSPSDKSSQQKRISENKELYENTSNDSDDFEAARIPESQPGASDSKIEPVVLLDSGEFLVPVTEGDVTSKTGTQSTFYCAPDVSADNDRDSLSSTSWSYVEDSEEFSEQKDDPNTSAGSVAMASDASTAAALAACSDAQRGMDSMTNGLIVMEQAMGDQTVGREHYKRHDSMSSAELKQAIVSMMLRKDEIEEQNRNLQSQLDEEHQKSQQLDTKNEQLREEMKQQGHVNTAKIASLSRENELLKHQLKKYVGAVQALRSGTIQGNKSAEIEVLTGIRQDEILPSLPPEQATEQARQSDEAEEYKRKLIQVADLHGELLEFNERLHKQVNYYQFQVRRLREELINLRGPLPEDTENLDDLPSLSDFDPAVMSVGTRPLVNVWIPSVFLRGRSSSVHHVYQVYVRIKDDEWNIYRRYSQFFEMHKSLRQKFQVIDSFKFPPKKTLGNKDSRFVEDRRKLLQDYLRRVVNLYVTTDRELRDNTTKTALLQIIPFFAEPFPPEKVKKESSSRRKRSVNYTGL